MNAATLELKELTVADLFNNGGGDKRLLLTDVSWAEYENLVRDNLDKTNLKLAYDEGRLEIMAKGLKHGFLSQRFGFFAAAYC